MHKRDCPRYGCDCGDEMSHLCTCGVGENTPSLWKAEVDYFMKEHLWRLIRVLEGSPVKYVRRLAEFLKLPTRYDDKSLKPKDVLAAAIYEHFRQARMNAA